MAQAAATPKTMLSGTAMAATSSVSRIAASASGSAKRGQEGVDAAPKASENTASSGSTRNSAEEADGERDQRPAHQPVRARSAAPLRIGRTSARLQACRPLMTSSVRNEIASMTVAMAAAPA